MELRQIRYFVAVANARSFTRAAEQLHIAQPPLSRQIQLLEGELGVQLLARDSRPLQITEAGRVFYEQALQVLHRVEQMKAATIQVGLGQREQLSIGFVASTLYGLLPLLTRKLRQAYPHIDFQLLELTTMQQIAALKAGRIDIGFGRLRINDRSVSRIVLYEERLALAIPPGYALAAETGPLPFAALNGLPLIVYPKEPRPSFADQVLNLLHDYGIQPGHIHEVRELQAAVGLVASEVGVCVIPAAARFRNDLVYRPIEGERATSPVILSHRANDSSWYIDATLQLINELQAEKPSWLDPEPFSSRLSENQHK
ncbi:LysR family transcriptional regulator [Pusillimonas sp. MFBS29]|uniref:LysR substrate-binding domain-containing protein n=1 Tax=Pusillimonas sp. MFBS29 TaxID=2886690 RepID=UPI001D11B744|nr:LysR substrate-binding domain-containing protein [Pusillimonas sp. MFBS29]MCC2596035.1 LysR family transcriptional regulator [Pusillimonas sp. MFBS29]